MILSDIISVSQKRLAAADIDNPALDARLIIAHALRCDRLTLTTGSERILNEAEIAAIGALIARREKREPVHRIIGRRDFWGLSFGLNEATLEPRPDSETLIEVALKHCKKQPLRILDLGTGTGCLLLALLHEWPAAIGLGIDKAPRAVERAAENAKHLELDKRAEFRVGDWLQNISETFDVIICNPPYIPAHDIESLHDEVRNHDPHDALDGGDDGLNPYKKLIPMLPNFLNAGGIALFEIGIGQAQDVSKLMRENGFRDVVVSADLGGVARCVSGQKP